MHVVGLRGIQVQLDNSWAITVRLCVLQQHRCPNDTGERKRHSVRYSETHARPFVVEPPRVTVASPWWRRPSLQLRRGRKRLCMMCRDVNGGGGAVWVRFFLRFESVFPSVSATISESDVFGVIKTRADPLLTSIIHDPGMFLEGICKLNSESVFRKMPNHKKNAKWISLTGSAT